MMFLVKTVSPREGKHLDTAPPTGFEPARPLSPTAFKAAPSPPGQTAYIGHPGGIRNRVGWMKTSYPRPLDDGAIDVPPFIL